MLLTLTTIFAFLFGAIVGSFLNVVIHRVPLGLSVVKPASRCPTCGNGISWYDNIPIFSWAILLRAKCRNCKSPISARYTLVELLMGVLSAFIWHRYAATPLANALTLDPSDLYALGVPFLMYFVFVAFLITIAFIDLEHMIIPHGIAIPGILLGVASPWVLRQLYDPYTLLGHWPPLSPGQSLVGMVAGALIIVSIFVLYFAARGIPGMGGGDVTLMALVGAWLGWPALFFIFLASSVQGLLAAGVGMAFGSAFIKDANEIFEEDERLAQEAEAARAAKKAGLDAPHEQPRDEAPKDDPQEHPEQAQDEPAVDEGPGPMAIPFGPFIVLSALEYFFLGPWLPDTISMASFYGF